MQPTMCSRCGKNVAVVFITKIEGGQTKNEGLCLKCARELHIKPIDDVINKMGLSDEELDSILPGGYRIVTPPESYVGARERKGVMGRSRRCSGIIT